MKSKTAIAIVLLIACVLGLSIAYVLLPHRIDLDDPNFVITKQLKPKFSNGIPPWRIEYDLTVTYRGQKPIYIQLVGQNIHFVNDSVARLRFGRYHLIHPGDAYTSHVNDSLSKAGISFKYSTLREFRSADGLPNYRTEGPAQTIIIEF